MSVKIIITHPKIQKGGIVRVFETPKVEDITQYIEQAARLIPYGNFEPVKEFRHGNYNGVNTRHLFGLNITLEKINKL